jgi:sugar phosphate isomerase/epimerase
MNTLSMSSYSVREHLGPSHFTFVDAQGAEQSFGFDFPQLMQLHEFPARARAEFGVTNIETVQFQFKEGLDDPELDLFAQALRDSSVTLLNVAIDVGDLLADDPTDDIALLKEWILRFAAMGSTFVRVNPGSPFSPHHGEEPPASLVAALQELGAFAAANGTRLLVENHGGPSSDPVWMSRLLDAVGKEHLGLLLDLGNFDALLMWAMAEFFGGAKPEGEPDLTTLYEGIEALADYAELVHVKAHEVAEDGSVGHIDLPKSLGILASHGYRGPLTVEYEGTGGDPWAKSHRVLEVTRVATA